MYNSQAPWDVFFESVRQVGPERVILSTDLGQTAHPTVALGFAMFGQKMLDAGFKKTDVRRMAVTNPAALVT
jgi:predicted metal-dependent TIM-barrel fold hydrolase